MKKLAICLIAFVLVFPASLDVNKAFSVSENISTHFATLAPTLEKQLGDLTSSETMEAVIWTTSPIDKQLQSLQKEGNVFQFNSFSYLSSYYVNASKEGIETISAMPEVIRIQENYKITTPVVKIAASDDKTNWGLADLKIQNLWDKGLKGAGVTVGLLDSGVDGDHPDLAGKILKFSVFDSVGKLIPDIKKPYDNVGHGTHCAGIIAGGRPGKIGTGVAPDAKLIVGSVLPNGSGSLAQVIGGMQWMIDPDGDPNTNDAPQILSMSLGGSLPDEDMVAACDALERNGIMLVASIGNSGDGMTGSPGNVPSSFSVGNYTKQRTISYSSSGDIIDWEIEPYHVNVIKPDVSAPGTAIYSTYPKSKYATLSGTSMACPHVAGVSALLMSHDNSISMVDLKSALVATSDDLGKKGWDTRFGSGAINPNAALDYLSKTGTVKLSLSGAKNKPVTLNIDGKMYRIEKGMTLHLPPGQRNISMELFGYKKFNNTLTIKAGQTQTVNFKLDELPKTTYEVGITDEKGNPVSGRFSILGTTEKAEDVNGNISIEVPSDEYEVEYWGIGCVPKRMTVNFSKDNPKTVQLERTKTLVVTNQYTTPQLYLPRRFDKYCTRAFDEAKIKYCPINPRNFDLNADILANFERVYWFAGETYLSRSDAETLRDYLAVGGKLLISGPNLLYYENARREHAFFKETFDVLVRQPPVPLTTMVGVKDDDIGDGLVLSISGGDGASNQIVADGFVTNKSPSTPFMHYLGPKGISPADIGSTGLKYANGKYAAILLSFGFEGINNKNDRSTLLTRIEKWFDNYGEIELNFEDNKGKPVKTKIKIESPVLELESDDTGKIKISSIPFGQIQLKATALGFQDQTFKAEVVKGRSTKAMFSFSNPASITITGTTTDSTTKQPIECNIKIYSTKTETLKTDSTGNFSITLPRYDYVMKIFKKGFMNAVVKIPASGVDKSINMIMEKSRKPVAMIQQITPSWEPALFAGIGQDYDRTARTAGIEYDTIQVPAKTKLEIEDLQQYPKIVWYFGYNDEMSESWFGDVVTEYIDNGGALAIIGQYVPQTISETRPDLAKKLGYELTSSNSNVMAVVGSKDDPIGDGLMFSIYHRYMRNGLLSITPSMKPVGNGVSSFNLIGSDSAAVRVSTDKQKTIILNFGIEDMYADSKDHAEFLKRIVNFLGN
jgi:hypothetical protein